MLRLKIELETCYAEDRADTLRRAHEEHLEEINRLKETYSFKEKMLQDEIESIKLKLADRNRRLDEANEKADKQIMQIRMILDKSERNHQREIDTEINDREEYISESLNLLILCLSNWPTLWLTGIFSCFMAHKTKNPCYSLYTPVILRLNSEIL